MNKVPQAVSASQTQRQREPQTPRFSQFLRPLLAALGVILLILVLCQIAEGTWLSGLDRRSLRPLRLAKGASVVLVLAVGVGWMILKASPRLIVVPPNGEDWQTLPRPTVMERGRIYAWWFICMRWIAVVLAGILIYAGVWLFRWLPREVWWPLLLTVASLGGSNLIYMLCLYQNRGRHLLPIQAYVDLAFLILLLHLSGGVENPLTAILIFHVIIGGILLSRGQCYGLAGTASGLFALMVWGEWLGILTHHELLIPLQVERGRSILHLTDYPLYVFGSCGLQTVVLFLTAYFVTTLAERMRNDERRLEVLAGRALAGQQLLEQALETTGTGLRVLHGNLETHWANNRWKEWFEQPPGPESPAAQLLNGENSPARRCMRDGEIQVTELELDPQTCGSSQARPGASRWVFQVTTAPLKNDAGQIQQIAELAENITQHKETQSRMVRAGQLAVLGQIAGRVVHEVNNPIAIISGKARLLLTNHGQQMIPQIAQDLAMIAESADRVGRITKGLLSYARPSSGDRSRLNICDPVRRALGMVEDQARRMGVLIQDFAPTALPAVCGNANELEQVFLNLFLNALDAMPKGGRLRVSAQLLPGDHNGNQRVAVVVEDTGTGISPEIRERIFDAFFTTKQEGRGTGLGLSICLGLVHSHGGAIKVETEPGRGTRFIIQLPIDTSSNPKEKTGHACL